MWKNSRYKEEKVRDSKAKWLDIFIDEAVEYFLFKHSVDSIDRNCNINRIQILL